MTRDPGAKVIQHHAMDNCVLRSRFASFRAARGRRGPVFTPPHTRDGKSFYLSGVYGATGR